MAPSPTDSNNDNSNNDNSTTTTSSDKTNGKIPTILKQKQHKPNNKKDPQQCFHFTACNINQAYDPTTAMKLMELTQSDMPAPYEPFHTANNMSLAYDESTIRW